MSVALQRGQGVDLELLSGVPWWYNWGLTPGPKFSSNSNSGQEFVAMVWGGHMAGALPGWVPHPSTKVLL